MKNASVAVVASRTCAGVFLLTTVLVVTGVSAQQRIEFFFTATTLKGEPVTDLKADEVEVSEDGRPGTVVKLVPIAWPIRLTVLVDNGYTGAWLAIYRSGLKALFSALPPGVEASLLTLSPQPRWLVRPTADGAQLAKGVDRLTSDESPSRVIDGLIEAAGRIEQDRRKEVTYFPVIVIVSTTGPEGSTALRRDVERMARQLSTSSARIHVIMLNTGAKSTTEVLGARQTEVGKSVADMTGGRYEAIAAPTRIPALLAEYGQMIVEAHAFQSHQYMITVERPAGASPEGQLQVVLPARPGHRVTATARGLIP